MTLSVIPSYDPGSALVERLEEVLVKAKNGELSMVAIATVDREGCSDWCFSDLTNASMMLGSIERMKHAIIRRTD